MSPGITQPPQPPTSSNWSWVEAELRSKAETRMCNRHNFLLCTVTKVYPRLMFRLLQDCCAAARKCHQKLYLLRWKNWNTVFCYIVNLFVWCRLPSWDVGGYLFSSQSKIPTTNKQTVENQGWYSAGNTVHNKAICWQKNKEWLCGVITHTNWRVLWSWNDKQEACVVKWSLIFLLDFAVQCKWNVICCRD